MRGYYFTDSIVRYDAEGNPYVALYYRVDDDSEPYVCWNVRENEPGDNLVSIARYIIAM